MRRSLRKNEKQGVRDDAEAVSPVIAIILMVAITVVLAGVLYVWVNELVNQRPAGTDPVNLDGEIRLVDETTAVFELTHRGGDPIEWSDYRVTVNETVVKPGTERTSVGETATFSYDMSPQNELRQGVRYTAMVIDLDGMRIVWESGLTARAA